MIRSLWEKFRNFFSTEVPDNIAACEFDCRKLDCPKEDFLNCPRRLEKVEEMKNLSETDPKTNFVEDG